MARGARDVVTISVRVPVEIHEASRAVADSIYQSLNQFVVQAMAQRVRNWKDPVSGRRVVRDLAPRNLEGWVCTHGSHGEPLDAAQCPYAHVASHRLSWLNDEVNMSFDEWAKSEGIALPAKGNQPTDGG